MASRDRRVPGSRQYKNYSEDMLEIAVDLVRSKKISSYDAEKAFHIPRRTILNRARGKHDKKVGTPYKLSEEDEAKVVKVLVTAGEFGSPITPFELRLVVFDFLKKNGEAHLFNNKAPGEWWARSFIRRHKDKITTRHTQNIKTSRASKSVNEMTEYFNNLRDSLQGILPENILNYDESNLTDDPGSRKCIFKRKVKHPEMVMNSSKSSISIMFAVTGDGHCLPPYTVYKSEHLWTLWCQNGPENSRYNRTKSGWFDLRTFEDWFQTIALPWAQGKQGTKVMIGDNLSSHLNVDIIQACETNNIRLVFLPPNSTHLTQPLDVAYFGPMKRVWRNILEDYKFQYPGTTLDKCMFPNLLKELMLKMELSKSKNIISGFRATGIIPLDPLVVLKKLPDYDNTESQHSIDQCLLEYLQKRRGLNKPVKAKSKNKKVNVEPGKSVSTADVTVNIGGKTLLAGSGDSSAVKILSNIVIRSANKPSPIKTDTHIHINVTSVDDNFNVEPCTSASTATLSPESSQRLTAPSSSSGAPRNLDKKKSLSGNYLRRIYNENSSDSDEDHQSHISFAESDQSVYSPHLDEMLDVESSPKKAKQQLRLDSPVEIGDYVLVNYDNQLYPGQINEVENDSSLVSAMVKCGKYWKWPVKPDSIWYQTIDIIGKIQEPSKISRRNIFKVPEIQD